jgi:hypothetical protein
MSKKNKRRGNHSHATKQGEVPADHVQPTLNETKENEVKMQEENTQESLDAQEREQDVFQGGKEEQVNTEAKIVQEVDAKEEAATVQEADAKEEAATVQEVDAKEEVATLQEVDTKEEQEASETEADNEQSQEMEDPSVRKIRATKGKMDQKLKMQLCIACGSVVAVFVIGYLITSIFFMNHFLFQTTINGIDFTGKTVSDVQTYLESQVEAYELTIVHHSGKKEVIDGEEISLEYVSTSEAKELMDAQQSFLWPMYMMKKSEYTLETQVVYNEESLQAKIAGLDAVTGEQTPPTSAYPRFDGNWYVIEPEVLGTQIQVEVLQAAVVEAVGTLTDKVNLLDAGCYVMPTYTSKSGEVQEACNTLNDYLVGSVTYQVGEEVVVDRTVTQGWLVLDEAMNVSLNQQAIRDWLTGFGNTYDTVGTTRTLTTPTGKVTQVSGGTYGWSIDEDAEFDVILQAIQNGEQIVKEPTYAKTAAAHSPQDWGNTYIEVDLSQQYMWYISNGAVVMESDVVTGLPTYARMTPQGVYDILTMQMHTTLVGDIVPETGQPEYRQPVDFWMSVTWSGIGFHDAVWQSAFGGDLYLTVGSHGCINLPYGKAQQLYSLISVGTPVVMHY